MSHEIQLELTLSVVVCNSSLDYPFVRRTWILQDSDLKHYILLCVGSDNNTNV